MHPIKAILFDLDGVLVNTTVLHYETFRDAVNEVLPSYTLTWRDNEVRFEGMSTNLKLKHLREEGVVNDEQSKLIFEKKQELIAKRIPFAIQPREALKLMLITLNNQGFRLFCCSNSVRKTLDEILTRLDIREFFEATYSNEDVQNPKPSPEIYQLAMRKSFLQKEWCLILEDSQVGRAAAYASGAYVLEVEDAGDVTYNLIRETLYTIEKRGCVFPRTLPFGRPFTLHCLLHLTRIPVDAVPQVIESLIASHIQEEHYRLRFHIVAGKQAVHTNHIDRLFWDVPGNVSYTYHVPKGDGGDIAVLEKELETDEPMVFLETSPPLHWSPDSFYKCLLNASYDGCIITTFQPDPYTFNQISTKSDENGILIELQKKKWISPYASLDLYGWRKSRDFLRSAKKQDQRESLDIVTLYNDAIKDGIHVRTLLSKGV
jgi:HAD superfamily hydrolase (TIGR01509 family)